MTTDELKQLLFSGEPSLLIDAMAALEESQRKKLARMAARLDDAASSCDGRVVASGPGPVPGRLLTRPPQRPGGMHSAGADHCATRDGLDSPSRTWLEYWSRSGTQHPPQREHGDEFSKGRVQIRTHGLTMVCSLSGRRATLQQHF